MERVDTTETVETPERIRFRVRLAGPGQRAAALSIDLVLQAMLAAIVTAVFTLLSTVVGGYSTGVMLLGLFALNWFYGVATETAFSGRTPGKMAMELRVLRTDGSAARFPDLVVRNLVRAADFLPFGFALGVLTMMVDPKLRRLGDLAAGTIVVAEDRTRLLRSIRIDPPVSEEERQALPARVHLTPEEREALEAFLVRRPRLNALRAEELAAHFGPALSAREGVVAPTWERVLTLAYARATGKDREA
jgi:uncharacterized RDD family membrane protein YckC